MGVLGGCFFGFLFFPPSFWHSEWLNWGKDSEAEQCHSSVCCMVYGAGDISPSASSIPSTLNVVWEVGHGSVHSLWT